MLTQDIFCRTYSRPTFLILQDLQSFNSNTECHYSCQFSTAALFIMIPLVHSNRNYKLENIIQENRTGAWQSPVNGLVHLCRTPRAR